MQFNFPVRFYGLCQRIFEARWVEFLVIGVHRPSDASQASGDNNENGGAGEAFRAVVLIDRLPALGLLR